MLVMPNLSDVLARAKLEPGRLRYIMLILYIQDSPVQLCAHSLPPWFAAHKHRLVSIRIRIHFLRISVMQCYLTGASGKSEVSSECLASAWHYQDWKTLSCH